MSSRLITLGLYRRILKLHKSLPSAIRYVGDSYVRDEFKHHEKATPEQQIQFLGEWKKYADLLQTDILSRNAFDAESSTTSSSSDHSIAQANKEQLTNLINQMSDQQIGQAYALKQAIDEISHGESVTEEEMTKLVEELNQLQASGVDVELKLAQENLERQKRQLKAKTIWHSDVRRIN